MCALYATFTQLLKTWKLFKIDKQLEMKNISMLLPDEVRTYTLVLYVLYCIFLLSSFKLFNQTQ